MLARLAFAVAEVAVVERERHEALPGQAVGVRADHLVLDARQGAGEGQRGQAARLRERAVGGHAEVAGEPEPLASERDALGLHG